MKTPTTHLSFVFALQRDEASPDAWERFVTTYRPVIVSWCIARGFHADLAEDLAQQILLKVFRSIAQFQPAKAKFRTWLNQIVKSVIVDFTRRDKRTVGRGIGGDALIMDLIQQPEAIEIMDQIQQPEAIESLVAVVESYQDPILFEAMRRARLRMSESTWQIFEQTVIHGRTVADVAKERGESVGKVHMAKHRAIAIVADEYAKVKAERLQE